MAAASQPQDRPESDVDEEFIDYESEPEPSPASQHNRAVPALFTTPPPVRDALPTATSKLQDDTLRQCLPFLAADPGSTAANPARNAHGVPALLRDNHVKFLEKQLGRFPAPYVAADASRPWFLYWSLNALALLGYDTAVYRDDLIATVRTMQNLPGGGFGGGHGQNSHLATTYAVVLALAIVGGEDAYDVIDRRAMWRWICSLKQRDGGIQMTLGGEVDVRPSDAYHTCYVLSGLSSAQHRWDLTYVNEDETILPEPKWVVSPCAEGAQIFDEEDRVGTIHPVYTIPQESVDDMKAYFAARQGF
ncbi:hypothetical protein K4K51_010438 [Colletotrichum sp. SAR 10_75]|nr:hypothetical protein K4K51_010438 [Colletotrichum sp. SAR 10_75]